jgi:hypothetical protein
MKHFFNNANSYYFYKKIAAPAESLFIAYRYRQAYSCDFHRKVFYVPLNASTPMAAPNQDI